MKLFTIPLPNGGGELVGLGKTNDRIYRYREGLKWVDFWFQRVWQKMGNYEKNTEIIGTLSEVTEDMAKDWGFDCLSDEDGYVVATRVDVLINKIRVKVNIDLSNILLIIIKK
jgi:hypothetical protein